MRSRSGPAVLAALTLLVASTAAAQATPPATSSSAAPSAPLPSLASAHPAAKPLASAAVPAPAPAPAPPTPPKKPAPAVAKTTKPSKPGASAPPGARSADAAARRSFAGGPTADDVALGVETPELRALHQAELELFPPAIPPMGTPWPNELASPLSATEGLPRVHASGLPPSPTSTVPRSTDAAHDLTWLSRLQLPDLPVRWDARLVRYLEFYRDDPRGHQLMAYWIKRSGRYREALRRSLRKKALPEDLAWLPMVESGYDATARSPAGAGGLWQLTADTAHLYGLSTDRWADQRFNVASETEAAVEMLSDLNRRFGSWELAMAAYNMGYGGVTSVVRRYNTNDYWTLSRLEAALPWETVLYVPKVVAAAIVGRNLAVFGLADVVPDPAIESDEVRVRAGLPLQAVASAAGCTLKEVEALNPELRAGRTPPASVAAAAGFGADGTYPVKVPLSRGATAQANLAKSKDTSPVLEHYTVKFGESLDQIATAHGVPLARLIEVNGIASGEVIHGGTVLLLPHGAGPLPAVVPPPPARATDAPSTTSVAVSTDGGHPVVVVPPDLFVYPDRKRAFYRVLTGDTLAEIARHLHVDVDDLRRWNDLDPAARLQDGMTLQVFVPEGADVSRTVLIPERDAHVLVAGTDEFFAYWEGTKGKRRIVVVAKAGETVETIGKRHGVNPASMERINGRGRRDVLKEGETVVVYVPAPGAAPVIPAERSDALGGFAPMPTAPNGPLPQAPQASLLPLVR